MNKYIIKNCPAIFDTRMLKNTCCNIDGNCQDCTDCLLKRIIERCKIIANTFDYNIDVNYMAKEILSMLEIEECK